MRRPLSPLTPGHVTVLHFWATWCVPCQRSFPELETLREKERARGLEVIAVSVDDDDSGIVPFTKQHNARFEIVWDKDHSDADCWQVPNMPSTYVIDAEGVLRFIHLGYHPGEAAVIEREVESLLKN